MAVNTNGLVKAVTKFLMLTKSQGQTGNDSINLWVECNCCRPFSPHFPYQPCRACRTQQQNYLM